METLAKKLQGKVQFVFVYVQESHPNRVLNALPGSPVEVIPALAPTLDCAERKKRAEEFRRLMEGSFRRILVDEDGDGKGEFTKVQCLYHMENSVSRNFVIDRGQRVAAKATIDVLSKQLSEIFPELASDLHEDDADHFSSDLPAGGG